MKPAGSEILDVIVVGGGISGLGVAREAKKRGCSVLLLEKGKCSSATSKNSLRIVHGGFRYLQHFNFPRVVESLRDQQALIRAYPDHVQPLPCVMPLQRFGLKSRYPVACAAALYRYAARILEGASLETGYRGLEFVRREIPLIAGASPYGVLLWTDALMKDPLRFAEVLKGELEGSVIEDCTVDSIVPFGDFWRVEAGHDAWTARSVVNAAGPWLFRLNRKLASPAPLWCKAFNLILSRRFHEHYAIGFHGETRLYFLAPRGDITVLGTEYIPFDGNPDHIDVTESEAAAFIQSFNEAFPEARLKIEETAAVEAGILPMKRVKNNYPQLYGMERLHTDQRYVEVLSTKYTTFLSQARKVMDNIHMTNVSA